MSNWTRAHDAHIARECEGLEVEKFEHLGGQPDYGVKTGRMPMRHPSQAYTPIDHYNTDPAACIRAAEAWRNQKPGRSYETRSQIDEEVGTQPANAVCFSRTTQIAGGGQGESALAQALIRATGGPA